MFKKKAVIPAILALLSVAMLSGCATITGQNEPAVTPETKVMTKKEAATEIEKIGAKDIDNILKSIEENNYVMFKKNFTIEMRKTFPKKGFPGFVQKFKKDFGTVESKKYLGHLSVGALDVLLWKARCTQNSNDVLITITIGHVDGMYQVFGWSIK